MARDSKFYAIVTTRPPGGKFMTAMTSEGRVRVRWDVYLRVEKNHQAALQKLLEVLGWKHTLDEWVGGEMPDRRSYAWVRT